MCVQTHPIAELNEILEFRTLLQDVENDRKSVAIDFDQLSDQLD